MAKDVIKTLSPSTSKAVVERVGVTFEEAENVLARSKQAFKHPSWKKTTLAQRTKLVSKALSLIQARKHELAHELTMQMGRPIKFSVREIETMQKRADYLLDIAEEALADLPGTKEAGFQRWLQKEPIGPILIVFAWNYPYLIIVNSMIPALLAGNTVVLKPSPQTPLIGERLVEIFEEAGLPHNVLQNIHCGSPAMLAEIVQIPDIQSITFTGSTKVGLQLREAVAGRVIPLNLELGGNDPAYVRADADLKYVAEQLVDGCVFNSGQSCCAVERIYVEESVHDEFVKELQDELKNYRLGDPFNKTTIVGPVISAAAKNFINEHVEDALGKGAIDATPENESFMHPPTDGNYVAPVLLTNVSHDMRIMVEETFGPIIPVCKVSGDDEAVQYMNNSNYGLTASVWTKDIERGNELLQEIEAGTVFLNRADCASPDLAWTGWKDSGLGCTLGPHGFDAFYKLKSYHVRLQQG